ncbi:MAG: sugar phosphate isomerase/epimerase family protein [Chloroflexota bacterium]
MTPIISFMLANYAARPLDYHAESWSQAEQATSAYFKPIKTFGKRFDKYLRDVTGQGFKAVDLWQPMLDYRWISDDHLEIALDLLDEYDLEIVSFGGWLGATEDQFEANCEIATEFNAPLVVGNTTAPRAFVIDALDKFGLRWAYENEQEKTPEAILAQIGKNPLIGICADTGWFATHGYDAADALRQLAPRLMHVHLKDVLRVGTHESCRYGQGIVPLERCVRVLQETGYTGAISVEHETAAFDPSDDCRASLERLQSWLP